MLRRQNGEREESLPQLQRLCWLPCSEFLFSFATPKNDVDLADFFVATSKTLLSPSPVQSGQLSVKGPSSPELFAFFSFALKDINELDVENAAQLLEQFVKTQPSGKFAWIAELKPI